MILKMLLKNRTCQKINAWLPTSYVLKKTRRRSTMRYAPRTDKKGKASRTAKNLPEGQTMKYIPYSGTGVIKIPPDLFRRLQKTRLLHSWNQKNHNATTMWGLKDVYKVLTAPNGHTFTICQVIMTTKCSYDYITPLFLSFDVIPEGEVINICSFSIKVEAESLLAHLGLYLAEILAASFGKPSHSNTNFGWIIISIALARTMPLRSITCPLNWTQASLGSFSRQVLQMICWSNQT